MTEVRKPIDMKEVRHERTQQEHFYNIAETIDEYADVDKGFMLWYLLGNYRERLSSELADAPAVFGTKQEYLEYKMMKDHLRYAEEMREILMYDIF